VGRVNSLHCDCTLGFEGQVSSLSKELYSPLLYFLFHCMGQLFFLGSFLVLLLLKMQLFAHLPHSFNIHAFLEELFLLEALLDLSRLATKASHIPNNVESLLEFIHIGLAFKPYPFRQS